VSGRGAPSARVLVVCFATALLAGASVGCRARTPAIYTDWQGTRLALRAPYERYALSNGLGVVMNQDDRLPIVALRLVYNVGKVDDPPYLDGFAHLFEHLMFQGSRHVGEDMFFHHLDRIGAPYIQGETHQERSVYSETVPANQLELALWLESDRMAFLLDHVNEATLDMQREVVDNERRERVENAPYGHVAGLISNRLFPARHPYRVQPNEPGSLAGASLIDVRRFWRTYYRPNNATLYLSGDFPPGVAKEQIEKYFGPIVAGDSVPRRTVPAVPELPPGARLDVEADVPLGKVILSWVTPAFGEEGDAELDILANMFEQGGMAWDLLEGDQLAADVNAAQHSYKVASVFDIEVIARPGADPARIVADVEGTLAKVREELQETTFIRSMALRLLVSLAQTQEEPTRRIAMMAEDDFITGDPNFIETNVARYEAITPKSLLAVAQKYLAPERRLLTVVTPVRGAPPAGRLVRSR
jgi:zinc protease